MLRRWTTNFSAGAGTQTSGDLFSIVAGGSSPHVSRDLLEGPGAEHGSCLCHTFVDGVEFELASLDERCNVEFAAGRERRLRALDRNCTGIMVLDALSGI